MTATWDGDNASPERMSPHSERSKPGYTNCNVVVSTGDVTDLHPPISTQGAKRTRVIIKNRHAARAVVCSVMVTGEETPDHTHDSNEWEQKPDGATTYTVDAETVVSKILEGPNTFVKVRGISDGALFDDSVDVYCENLY